MIKEPEDEAFEAIEKAQQRNALLVDKGCAERGCMGYDSRDGDTPVKMRVFDDDDDIQEYKKPWRGLTYEEESELIRLAHNHAGIRFYIQAAEAKLKEKNT
jgi:hypothetical protein